MARRRIATQATASIWRGWAYSFGILFTGAGTMLLIIGFQLSEFFETDRRILQTVGPIFLGLGILLLLSICIAACVLPRPIREPEVLPTQVLTNENLYTFRPPPVVESNNRTRTWDNQFMEMSPQQYTVEHCKSNITNRNILDQTDINFAINDPYSILFSSYSVPSLLSENSEISHESISHSQHSGNVTNKEVTSASPVTRARSKETHLHSSSEVVI